MGVSFDLQQRSLLSGDGPWKLEVEIKVEGHVFAGAIYEDSAEKIEALYRTYCAAPALEAENARLKGLLQQVVNRLETPNALHRYWEGIHQSDCDGCKLRNWLRKTLEHADGQ